jgi:uncharacterized protein
MQTKINQLKTWLDQTNDINLAILFGSYAKNTQHFESDLDLAIQLKDSKLLSANKKMTYTERLVLALEINVDIIDLNTAGQPLLSQIVKYGKLLKGDKKNYVEIMLKNINSNQDFTPYIQRMLTARRERLLSN